MQVSTSEPFKVGDWLIEPELLQISKEGDCRKLEFKTMEILLCLVANKGEVVSKKKLHDEIWKEVLVTDNALTRAVSKLRKAFDDDPLHPKYVETISKSGYRLIAPVSVYSEKGSHFSLKTTLNTTSKWLWILIVILGLGGLSLMSIISKASYSGFYDPVPVSTLLGPERGLAISPDGKKISFSYSEPDANNSDVYVKLLEDLSQQKFTDHETHQGFGIWSPDGNYMAYASVEDSTCGLYKEPSFGGQKIRIGDCYAKPEDFVWSPDGKTIAFTDIMPPQKTRGIIFLNLETGAAKHVFNLENGESDRDPAFTPDNQYLVFRRTKDGPGRDIYKYHLKDKKLTRLTFDNARIFGLDVFDDGNQIAFSSNRGGIWAMWKVSIDGGDITRFHINDRVPTEPRFSADGKRMVYKSLQDQTRIWKLEREGNEYKTPVQVASSTRAEMHPSFSADGKKIAFISDRSGFFEIWMNDLKTNSQTKLTTLQGSIVNSPNWSPDGSEIVYDARIGKDHAVYVLDIASKMSRTFIDLEGDQVNARYSIDGKHIYFASNHTGEWQIWKKAVYEDGLKSEQVTINGGYFLQEGPHQKYLYYSRSDTFGIWRKEKGLLKQETLFIPELNDIDWGSWVPVQDGIIYLNRTPRAHIYWQSYNLNQMPDSLYRPTKPVQMWSLSLSASQNRDNILFVQIENSEDEIMMVDFR